MLSAQYLLNPSLEICRTWYSGCPKRVADPYWFSGHMVKCPGLTAGLWKNDVRLISIDWKVTKLNIVNVFRE